MNIFPAIDLHDGKCVRLYKGDFAQSTIFSEDPVAVATEFEKCGAEYLHLVDLDGALSGKSVHAELIRRIIKNTALQVELGGGIRTIQNIETALNLGLFRVILGSAAVNNPQIVKEACEQFGAEKIVVGIDARNGMVATQGWEKDSTVSAVDLAKKMTDYGVRTIIYTDISRDGGLEGTNMEAYRKLQEIEGLEVTASGGISFEEEITALRDVAAAAILGKAIYSGKLDLERAVKLAE